MLITRRTTRDSTGRILAMEETRMSADDTQLVLEISEDIRQRVQAMLVELLAKRRSAFL